MPTRAMQRATTSSSISLTRLARVCLTLLAFCLAFALLHLFAAFRFVDGDEGWYIYAGRLVLEGLRPQVDFFYQQMPFMPYLYAAWFKLTGVGWAQGRLLSALLAWGAGALVYRCARRETGDWYLAVCALVLYTAASILLAWQSAVKTYAPANFFLVAAYTLWRHPPAAWRRVGPVLAGLAVGLAVGVRLPYLAALPAFALDALWHWREPDGRRRALCFLAGFVVALSPLGYFACLDWDAFSFDNLGYHALRTKAGLVGGGGQKLQEIFTLFGVGLADGASSFQIVSLTPLAVVFVLARLGRREIPLPLTILALLFVVNVMPTPTFTQYFCSLAPWLILLAVGCLDTLARNGILGHAGKVLAAGLLCVAHVAVSPVDIAHFTARDSSLETYLDEARWTSRALDILTWPEDRPVLTNWPGYLLESRRRVYPGLENQFSQHAGMFGLSEERMAHLHLVGPDALRSLVASRRYPVALNEYDKYEAGILAHGYIRVFTWGRSAVYLPHIRP